jgi:hypothetical protein
VPVVAADDAPGLDHPPEMLREGPFDP